MFVLVVQSNVRFKNFVHKVHWWVKTHRGLHEWYVSLKIRKTSVLTDITKQMFSQLDFVDCHFTLKCGISINFFLKKINYFVGFFNCPLFLPYPYNATQICMPTLTLIVLYITRKRITSDLRPKMLLNEN